VLVPGERNAKTVAGEYVWENWSKPMDNDLNSIKEINKIAEAIQAYRENKANQAALEQLKL
jgi:hypothetical protein